MSSFSASALASLSQAGWLAGRATGTLSYRLCLSAEGYAWFPAVATFLGEFGGLALTFPDKSENPDTLHFNACEASAGVDARWVRDNYAPRIGNANLCMISAYSNHLLLFRDDAGRVYGGYDDFLCQVASSGAEAIEALVSNRPLPEIE